MKNAYILLLITLAGSAQAITWADYYAAHQAEVNAAVTTAPHVLKLDGKGLTDLNGFDAVPGLNMLETLYLYGNQLRALPPTIFHGLNALRVLSLAGNQLRELPPTIFQGLNALRVITFNNNQLRELPPTIFQGLNALQELYFDDNQLIALPPTIFQGLNALIHVSLDHNRLTELSPAIFRGLNALQGLSLTNNQLRELPPTIFQGLNALQTLCLDNNQLRALPPTTFQGLNALLLITITNNRIPGTRAKLRATLQLPNNASFVFKTPDQEHIAALFNAIGQSNIVTVRRLINDLVSGRIRNPLDANILISSLRDYDGNNLLHAAILSAARHLASIAGKSQNVQGTEKEKDAQRAKLAKDKSIINASYMKLINAILACGDQCAQEMLATPNAAGQNVVKAAIEKLGLHNSPITEALTKLGLPAIDVKTKLESYGSAATRRLLEPRLSDENKMKD